MDLPCFGPFFWASLWRVGFLGRCYVCDEGVHPRSNPHSINPEGGRRRWSFLGEELLEEPILPSHLRGGFLTPPGGMWKYFLLLGPG